jgi:SWI/SNF-related matrix-associated actin-dependent regulator 1 of chromatin subfamily A
MLRGWGFEILPAVVRWEQDYASPKTPTIIPVENIEGLKCKLYPFQAEGVGFLNARDGRGLLGHEMGLGKTVMALAFLQDNPKALPAVVVCPASLKDVWSNECKRWTTLTPEILSGRTPWVPRAAERRDCLTIINYDILDAWQETLNRFTHTVILDECHYIKSSSARRTKATKAFCKDKPHVIALSGTPIVNRPVEFYTTLNILAPTQFNHYWDFVQRYCAAKHNGYGWDVSGSSNTDELNKRLSDIMLRRLKEDVLPDLPEKTVTTIPLTPNDLDKSYYEATLIEALGAWNEDEKPDPLKDITQIGKLRLAALDAKFDACKNWIDDFLSGGRKLVVFVVHHKTSDRLRKIYGNRAVYLDGRTDVRERSKVVEQFQADPKVQMLVGNIQVAGTGITLTAAQDAVFIEMGWTPAEHRQAEDRIHRIGQKGATNVYYLIAQDTLETDMVELIREKQKVLDSVLDGMVVAEGSIFRELKQRLRNKNRRKNEKR